MAAYLRIPPSDLRVIPVCVSDNMLSIRYAEHIGKCFFHISLFFATLPCILIGIKTFDKMFNVIFHDVTYHAFELKFHSKTEKL